MIDIDKLKWPIICKDGYGLSQEEYRRYICFKPSILQLVFWFVYPTIFYVKWKRANDAYFEIRRMDL